LLSRALENDLRNKTNEAISEALVRPVAFLWWQKNRRRVLTGADM
jgi:hypothetical protein